jgi:mannose-6-phosphate isomerase-like protein (cupin superfamily)
MVPESERQTRLMAEPAPAELRVSRSAHFVKKALAVSSGSRTASSFGKILRFDKSKKCSLHYHKLKSETFYLHMQRLKLRIVDSPDSQVIEGLLLESGDCMDVPPGRVHQMEALEPLELFEFSTQHLDEDRAA